ncbi:MAG: hydantoinase/oxoprolinase family protein, partial [Actinomycetota bacterium]
MAVGVDIGGTFTDFVVADGARLTVHKEPSTPHDPSEAFLRGLTALGVLPPARIVHGSTVATNAVLERRGARAALLTTAGFRDLLEIGRQTRRELYSFTPTKPLPLIPRERCFEVRERVDKHGAVLEPLGEVELDRVLDAVVASGAESLAVVFLFSFVNPEHERRVGERAQARGLQVSLSCEVIPEYREYERASTTAANAYVAPLMDRYLARVEQRLAEWAGDAPFGRLQIMQSNGGIISPDTARREAVRTVLSGPAGGVVGASRIARDAGFGRIVTFDMGGTSTDVALVDGWPVTSTEGSISELPIRVPMLDIHTVGAGGGSIARLDPAGGLRVGPESAGADPGPAAYGRGEAATVTDANVVVGRYDLSQILGGRLTLDADRARRAVRSVAEGPDLSPDDLAAGIIRVANVQMARAIRRVSVERGHDPRDFCLVAFGGGGPLHACDLAEETGIPTVLIPRFPGALSALGMLLTDIRKEYSRTVMHGPYEDPARLDAAFEALERTAAVDLAAEGIAAAG